MREGDKGDDRGNQSAKALRRGGGSTRRAPLLPEASLDQQTPRGNAPTRADWMRSCPTARPPRKHALSDGASWLLAPGIEAGLSTRPHGALTVVVTRLEAWATGGLGRLGSWPAPAFWRVRNHLKQKLDVSPASPQPTRQLTTGARTNPAEIGHAHPRSEATSCPAAS